MILSAVLSATLALAAAGDVVVLRAKGAQIDEAAAAFQAELAGSRMLAVDETTTLDQVFAATNGAAVVVGIGARAAQLALKQHAAPMVHCMVLQDARALDSERSVGVPLTIAPARQLEALRRLVPAAKRVGVLFDPRVSAALLQDVRAAAIAQGLELYAREVAATTAVPAAVDDLLPKVDALLVIPDATVLSKASLTFLVGRTLDAKKPTLGYSDTLPKVGLLAALAPGYADNGALCARIARRVLAGEAPSTLRAAAQMPGTLVVNVKTAARLGLSIPAALLAPPTVVVGR